jgi:hypothetical protein
MDKHVSVRDAILADVFASVLFAVIGIVWAASAIIKSDTTTLLAPLSRSVADTMFKTGRYELLRDTAMDCEKAFNQLAAGALHAQIKSDWTAAVVALFAIGMLLFNVWLLRGLRRDIDTLRSNNLMQPTGQQRPAAD